MSEPKNQQQVLEFVEQCDLTEDGVLTSPVLYSYDSRDNLRRWQVMIGIGKEGEDDERLAVTQEYIERETLPEGYCGIYWTVSGLIKSPGTWQTSKVTYVTQVSYPGKKNFTTPFTQAVIDVRSMFNLKVKKGHVLDKKDLKKKSDVYTFEELIQDERRGEYPWRVYMMALHDVNKSNNWQHVKFPCMVQPKYDGTPVVIVSHPQLPEMRFAYALPKERQPDLEMRPNVNGETNVTQSPKEEIDHQSDLADAPEIEVVDVPRAEEREYSMHVDAYLRGRTSAENAKHILIELYPALKKYPGLYVIGEMWKPGYGLQDISGSARRTDKSKRKVSAIIPDYYIFDCFYLDKPKMGFEERWAILQDLLQDVAQNKESHKIHEQLHFVRLTESIEVEDRKALEAQYKEYLHAGYEGGIIRNLDSPHEFGLNKEIRSYGTLKIKPRFDDEFPVLGFTQGKGKEVGAVIWICTENDEGVQKRTNKLLPLEERLNFTVTPNLDYDTRYRVFKKLTANTKFFEEKVRGSLYTISYSILSKDGLPQQPKGLYFREQKLNAEVVK